MRWSVPTAAVVVAVCGLEQEQAAAQPEAAGSARGNLAVTASAGYVFGWTDNPDDFRIKESCCSGVAVTGNVGMRIDENRTVGLRLGLGWLDGYYRVDFADAHYGVRMIPVDLAVGADVARVEHRAGERGGQLLHVLLEPFALVGERQAHAGPGQRLGDGPGDRALVGDAEHDAGLAGEHGP